ncbi:MAG: hypoxanthine phosphoribosyltransferase [Chlamydiales bacterium]
MKNKDNMQEALLAPTLKRGAHLELLISEQTITRKIAQVAKSLDDEYKGQEITIVMIMKGALCLVADLIRHIQIPCSIEFIQASSYGAKGTKRGELSIFGLEKISLEKKHVLVVDDIFDSGATLSEVMSRVKEQQPKSIKSLVLLSKNVPRKTVCHPDYVLFEIEDRFVVGYGLDYKEHYRGLPGVYALMMENQT